mmetsp:Transcript_14704/g.24285  ORF Transcript_14704/g.24285 Transcript_14704/m.24285 type:complete len:285 (+) Transcript_14704:288-1142(+)|eukprot:CAMPEP_0184645442 /NCGR_PEP_ID=MMETSP0308-20130426/1912_1 /TAXON_ID=38269 /ORGANISM="Gloeochaete witrockiana, Strain SAG 46.84" /LENGTH=284 /DNA_ID=CAMNT_0027074429 /DNA_START=171 /DNA_END=1025 /DNA_ORIENTATION=+
MHGGEVQTPMRYVIPARRGSLVATKAEKHSWSLGALNENGSTSVSSDGSRPHDVAQSSNSNVYLAVPFSEKEIARSLGARWDAVRRQWYAPNVEPELLSRWATNDSPLVSLVGEDRTFGGNILFVDLIPKSCWFTNVRYCVHPRDWDRLRRHVYNRANNKCECCGAGGILEAHERWLYQDKQRIQKLIRLVALCSRCHEATHMGLAGIRGRGIQAIRHLQQVTKMSAKQADAHIEKAFGTWRERSAKNWKLDLSLLTDNGIEIVRPVKTKERAGISRRMLEQSN